MNKILLSEAEDLVYMGKKVRLVPFSCPEATGWDLDGAARDRAPSAEAKLVELNGRIRAAMAAHGYPTCTINWWSMKISVPLE